MKIAITANQKSIDSDVDPRFGRAPYILVYDLDNDTHEFIDNEQNLNLAQGAGIQTAQNVAKTGAAVVITGNCGPKAFKVLNAVEIKVAIQVSGKIKEAIDAYKKGNVKFSSDANVEGHWV